MEGDIWGFFEAQQVNSRRITRIEPFAVLLGGLDRVYLRTMTLAADNEFGRFVLMCHKAFVTAASLIAQAQPDDAMPITRRAIEMVRIAAASKENPDIWKAWLAFEKRHQRWLERQRGERPRPLSIPIPVHQPIVQALMDDYGILSDAGSHFTPEYFGSLGWKDREGMIYLSYFNGDQRNIENAILYFAATHIQILQVLSFCLDDKPVADTEWATMLAQVMQARKRYHQQYRSRYGGPGIPDPEDGNQNDLGRVGRLPKEEADG